MVIQAEAAECGVACLAMIAAYWGHHVSIRELRQQAAVSVRGTTLQSLIKLASNIGIITRPVKLDLKALPKLTLPCILHWNFQHFVVLKSVADRYVIIHDPSIGERRLGMDEFSQQFSGVALEASPAADFARRAPEPELSLRELTGKVVGLRVYLTQLLLLGIGLQLVVLCTPFYMQWVMDEAILSGDRSLLTVLGIGFLLLAVVQTLIAFARSWATTVLAASWNFQWFGNVFRHLLRLPLPYFENRHLGDIFSRFGSIVILQRTLTTQFVEALLDGVLVLATAAMMLLYSPMLTLISSSAVVLYSAVRWLLFPAMKQSSAEQILHTAKQNTFFFESIRGVQTLRLFNATDQRRANWLNMLVEQFNADLRVSRIMGWQQAAQLFIFTAERVVVLWAAASLVMSAAFTVGMLFAYMAYREQFTTKLGALIDRLFELKMLKLHGSRLADIVLTEPESEGLENLSVASGRPPEIVLSQVTFRYAATERAVLSGIDLSVKSGEFLAITGSSGCGKTTLAKVILGLLTPESGEVRIGGQPLPSINISSFRDLVGTVMQDDILFAGTIADNICFFDSYPDMAHLEHCARLAAIHDDVAGMPMRYNSLIGDIGHGLSGGQRQRILLARALYKRPLILLLDEATSHLDTDNEKMVNAAITNTALTRIVIAHRAETVALADRVVRLEAGRIADLSASALVP